MCQQLYSYLKRDESAINRLLITPIESKSGPEFGADCIKQNNRKTKLLLTKCNTFRNATTAELFLIVFIYCTVH